jgi:sugar phosphate isomerase/epimerase
MLKALSVNYLHNLVIMHTRREFIKTSGQFALGSVLLSGCTDNRKGKRIGVQLYSVRAEMLADAAGTLKQLAAIGYTDLESARSEKGNYYGLEPKQIKTICEDLGMKLISGHVHIDKEWKKSIEAAVESGQEYLVCSSLPSSGQSVENYKRAAEIFSEAAGECKKAGLIFCYHNHDYEFDKVDGKVLYDVLLNDTDSKLVKMELDLGWVVASGNDPVTYFDKYPGRFPLWHLKDMDKTKKQSTEFGKGKVDIKKMLMLSEKSGMEYFFVEQEEYAGTALESMKYDFDYLQKLKY